VWNCKPGNAVAGTRRGDATYTALGATGCADAAPAGNRNAVSRAPANSGILPPAATPRLTQPAYTESVQHSRWRAIDRNVATANDSGLATRSKVLPRATCSLRLVPGKRDRANGVTSEMSRP